MGGACSRQPTMQNAVESQPLNENADVETYEDEGSSNKPSGGMSPAVKGGIGCGVCVLLFGCLFYFGGVHVLTGMAITKFITLDDANLHDHCGPDMVLSNLTDNSWWPGCGDSPITNGDFSVCTGGCINPQTMQDMDIFNTRYSGMIVNYSSRAADGYETVRLSGWWLPAPNHTQHTPRIVIQHGFTSNSNQHRQMFLAYQLRKMGFSVLVNNLRDHCYSADSHARVTEWGHAYPQDTLGAWDYAVNDPGNMFGGPIAPNKVGISGFSMGAFITSMVFGLESAVPAVWVDGPPSGPKSIFAAGARSVLAENGVAFLAGIFMDPVWSNVEAAAMEQGIDIAKRTPEICLAQGADTNRSIFLVSNRGDTTVPWAESVRIEGFINTYPNKYNLVEKWDTEGACGGHTHCEDHIRIPAEYEAKMCSFWCGVFGLSETSCGLTPIRRLQSESESNEFHTADEVLV